METKPRRICIYGGAGTGKSHMAAELFALMKARHMEVEFVQEAVKAWAFEGRNPKSFDQWYLFGSQARREDLVLRSDPSFLVVTESPLLLCVCYSLEYGTPGAEWLKKLSDEFDKKFPPLNIFLDNDFKTYKPKGRFQTKEEAQRVHEMIRVKLDEWRKEFFVIDYRDTIGALELMLRELQ